MTEYLLSVGLPSDLVSYLFVPALIIAARILDVSISTIRLLLVMNGKRHIAPFVGAIEVFLWITIIGQIIKGENSMISYVAYGVGFGLGTYIGMKIEEAIAIGQVMIKSVTAKPADELIVYLKKHDIKFSHIEAETNDGPAHIIWAVIERKGLPELTTIMHAFNPGAQFTVANVRSSENITPHHAKKLPHNRKKLFVWKRK